MFDAQLFIIEATHRNFPASILVKIAGQPTNIIPSCPFFFVVVLSLLIQLNPRA